MARFVISGETALILCLIVIGGALGWALTRPAPVHLSPTIRRVGYPLALAAVILTWVGYMVAHEAWALFQTRWPITLTMVFGSFVAGATAEGGGAIAFPVFTKGFAIPATDARSFGLMIQSVGMTMAALVILLRGIPVCGRTILWVSLGGIIGQVVGAQVLVVSGPAAKVLFSTGAAAFGAALILSRWWLRLPSVAALPGFTSATKALFIGVGVIGGAFSSVTGTGADMLAFVVLTLVFGLCERVATPTTVVIMALNSIAGFANRAWVLEDLGGAWDLWLVCVPVVVIGAPLGAYVASRANRDQIIGFLCVLIAVDLVSTAVLVPMTGDLLWLATGSTVACGLAFLWMLTHRRNGLAEGAGPEPRLSRP